MSTIPPIVQACESSTEELRRNMGVMPDSCTRAIWVAKNDPRTTLYVHFFEPRHAPGQHDPVRTVTFELASLRLDGFMGRIQLGNGQFSPETAKVKWNDISSMGYISAKFNSYNTREDLY